MSLDKWIKTEKKKDPPKSPRKEIKKEDLKIDLDLPKDDELNQQKPQESVKITKFLLTCTKKNCNYQRTLVKKKLSEKDQICRKCKSKMKVKEI